MVLSIGTCWVELLFPLKQGEYIYVRSDAGLPYARHRILSSYGVTGGTQGPSFGEGVGGLSLVCWEELIPHASSTRAFLLVR